MAGTNLLSLVAKIGIDDSEYNKGIKGAESKAQKLGKGLKAGFKVGASAIGVTAAAIGGLSKTIYGAAKDTADYGDKVDKMSQKIGISAKAYQEWDYVMKRSDVSIDSLKMGMKTLSTQAQKNSEEFQKLGISEKEVANLSKEDLFNKVIGGLANMEDSTERTVLATKLLGRAGADMAPLLNQGSDAIEAQKKMAEDYGMVMSDKTVKASAAFNDSMTTLSMTATGLKNRLMGDLLPGITSITDGLALMFTRDGQDEGIKKFNEGITATLDNVSNLIPKILDIGVPIVENIATSIIDNLPKLADTALSLIMELGTFIIQKAPDLLKIGITILLSLVQGITDNIPTLIPAVVSVITELATMLTNPDMLVKMIMAAIDLIIALADGLVDAIPSLIAVVPVIITNLVKAIIKAAPKLLKAGKHLLSTFIRGIKNYYGTLGKIGAEIIDKIKSKIQQKVKQAKTWGKDLIKNFVDGIKEKWKQLKSSVEKIPEAFKKLLGHSTPEEGPMKDDDKWMPDFMDNLISGIDGKLPQLKSSVDNVAGTISDDFAYDAGYGDEYVNETQKFEFTFAEGKAPLLQIARLLFPYMQVVSKEKGVRV